MAKERAEKAVARGVGRAAVGRRRRCKEVVARVVRAMVERGRGGWRWAVLVLNGRLRCYQWSII